MAKLPEKKFLAFRGAGVYGKADNTFPATQAKGYIICASDQQFQLHPPLVVEEFDQRMDPSSYQFSGLSTGSPHPVGLSMPLSSLPPSGPLGGFGIVPGGKWSESGFVS